MNLSHESEHLLQEVNTCLIDVCSLSPDKVTFFDWFSPPVTSCKYSAITDRAATSNLRAPSSHTQQWTPRRPENTQSKCSNPKSSGHKMLVCIKIKNINVKQLTLQMITKQAVKRPAILVSYITT